MMDGNLYQMSVLMKFCPTTLRFSCAVFNLLLKISALRHASFTTNAVSKKKATQDDGASYLGEGLYHAYETIRRYRLHLSLHILELR